MSNATILQKIDLDFQWPTPDPFLFCVHHLDFYPPSNGSLGPPPDQLSGRDIGQDFEGKDGWRMYHGENAPGFPAHPHRGFETITVVRRGLVDHSDSLGASGRYGAGDVQWMTAGRGVQHAEMFPLVREDRENTLELFQIWLNLPAKNKLVEPHYAMFWKRDIPRVSFQDDAGAQTTVELIAGSLDGTDAPSPPPHSWAADPENNVAVWLLEMEADARWTLPPGAKDLSRLLYYYEGAGLNAGDEALKSMTGALLQSDGELELKNGPEPSRLLLLQGRPIGEPVVQYGPFVMNTREEIQRAYADFQSTGFGGWPWPSRDPMQISTQGRYALYADGSRETPED